jgi:16S rRNA (cytidine1402-2'-O)-methyltransferase
MLYVVSTPIGNLQDMSPRAIAVLKSVDLIAAEDTRHSLKLLNHFDIHTPLTSYHAHNERDRAQQLVARILDQGISLALITDAGTPAISDPGAILVKAAALAGIQVFAVPGPSAAIAALSVSGFDNAAFSFYAFAPREKKELGQLLRSLAGQAQTSIFHESPHRVKDLLEAVMETLGDVPCSLSCDLTKLYEKTIRGAVSQVLAALRANDKAEKGEYVLVLDLSATHAPLIEALPVASLEARLFDQLLSGQDSHSAMDALITQGEKKNAVYAASLRLKKLLRDDFARL